MPNSSSSRPAEPPRPRLVLRVGVTGHRPGPSLPDTELVRVRTQVGALLAGFRAAADAIWKAHPSLFSPATPSLVALSALAEGADRILASESLSAGWTLDVVLPLGREDYKQDFRTSESAVEFSGTLAKARAVLELTSELPPRDRDAAYEASGLLMLDHTDILVAIWDGQKGRGRGGTHQIMVEAARREIPVIWLRSDGDQPLMLWHDNAAATPLGLDANYRDPQEVGSVAAVVARVTLPAAQDGSGTSGLHRFLAAGEQRAPWWSGIYGWSLRWLTGTRNARQQSIAERRNEWQEFAQALPSSGPLEDALQAVLFSRFLWADSTATRLGAIYRSAYILNFLLAASAVFVGVLAILDPWNALFANIATSKTLCVALEFGLILLIIALTTAGRLSGWHQRFLDTRRLAEMLRHGRLLAAIGKAGHGLGPAAADSVDGWTVWYARATFRELPLPSAVVDATYLQRAINAALTTEVADQIKYLHRNHLLLETVHKRLDRAGEFLFFTTVILCLVWLSAVAIYGLEGVEQRHAISHTLKSILTFLGAVLPAFAAALSGIRAQGDFGLAAQQSLTTEIELRRLVEHARQRMPTAYQEACALLEALADRMTSDLGTWRLMSGHRPLTVPG